MQNNKEIYVGVLKKSNEKFELKSDKGISDKDF